MDRGQGGRNGPSTKFKESIVVPHEQDTGSLDISGKHLVLIDTLGIIVEAFKSSI